MKKYLFFILLFLLLIPFYCQAIVEKTEQVFVTDDANLLNQESEDFIVKYSDFLYKKRKIDFYVVTVKNLENLTIENYTNQLFDQFKISDKGIIILVSKEDRQLRIQVGDKMVNTIDGNLIDQYMDTYFIPYLEHEEWNDGIINGYSALYKYICEEYGIDATSMEVLDKLDFITKYKMIIMMLIIWSISEFMKIYSYYKKKINVKLPQQISDRDVFLLVVVILGNIFVISISYVLKPIFLLFVLVFEGYLLYTTFSSPKLDTRKKEKKKTNLKKKK